MFRLLEKVQDLEKAFEITNKMQDFENDLLRKEIDFLREKEKEKEKAFQKVIVELSDQLKEAKYNIQVLKAIINKD